MKLLIDDATHVYAGVHLAKLEMTCLLKALIPGVRRFDVRGAQRQPHNTLRGLSYLETSLGLAVHCMRKLYF